MTSRNRRRSTLTTKPRMSRPAASAEPDLTAAAFFDIDNTLIHGARCFIGPAAWPPHKYLSRSQILDFV